MALNVSDINSLTRDVWGTVRDQLQVYVDRLRQRRPDRLPNVRRRAVELTVWELARRGRIRTDHEQELWEALRAFWEEFEPEPTEPLEMRLHEAWRRVKMLADEATEIEEVVNGC